MEVVVPEVLSWLSRRHSKPGPAQPSGATGAIDKLIHVLNLRIPADLDRERGFSDKIPPDQRPVVFVGPYEHHSNEVSWRETIADVVTIREDDNGHIDIAHLEEELDHHSNR